MVKPAITEAKLTALRELHSEETIQEALQQAQETLDEAETYLKVSADAPMEQQVEELREMVIRLIAEQMAHASAMAEMVAIMKTHNHKIENLQNAAKGTE